MKAIKYQEFPISDTRYYGLLAVLLLLLIAGLTAAYYMEHQGHYVTGMNNQVVWGLPHVFAIFLIVAASGALNVASIGTVFGQTEYKPLGRLSSWLAITLLVGGLMILVLDLGRPDRLIIAMTKHNFSSIFSWNIYFYVGFIGIVAVYLWFQMEKKMNNHAKTVGTIAFVWRLALTTATGSIFGFLVARELYDSAIMAPLFISLSLALGLAVFSIILISANYISPLQLSESLLKRLTRLTGIFVALVCYFGVVQHLTGIYAAEHDPAQAFILYNGGFYSLLFWLGQMLIGALIPLLIAFWPSATYSQSRLVTLSVVVCIGSFLTLYLIIIGGQAWPLNMFPGKEVSSSFQDGEIASYIPSVPETMLGFAGIALSLLLFVVGLKILQIMPRQVAD